MFTRISRTVCQGNRRLLSTTVTPTTSEQYQITRVVSFSKPTIDRSQIPLAVDVPVPQITSEPYTITRTPSKGLPVYELRKGGGTLKLTKVRKIGGEREVLKMQLEKSLMPKPEYVKINPLTGHVVIKVGVVLLKVIWMLTFVAGIV